MARKSMIGLVFAAVLLSACGGNAPSSEPAASSKEESSQTTSESKKEESSEKEATTSKSSGKSTSSKASSVAQADYYFVLGSTLHPMTKIAPDSNETDSVSKKYVAKSIQVKKGDEFGFKDSGKQWIVYSSDGESETARNNGVGGSKGGCYLIHNDAKADIYLKVMKDGLVRIWITGFVASPDDVNSSQTSSQQPSGPFTYKLTCSYAPAPNCTFWYWVWYPEDTHTVPGRYVRVNYEMWRENDVYHWYYYNTEEILVELTGFMLVEYPYTPSPRTSWKDGTTKCSKEITCRSGVYEYTA